MFICTCLSCYLLLIQSVCLNVLTNMMHQQVNPPIWSRIMNEIISGSVTDFSVSDVAYSISIIAYSISVLLTVYRFCLHCIAKLPTFNVSVTAYNVSVIDYSVSVIDYRVSLIAYISY
jgi:hypothetical protein